MNIGAATQVLDQAEKSVVVFFYKLELRHGYFCSVALVLKPRAMSRSFSLAF